MIHAQRQSDCPTECQLEDWNTYRSSSLQGTSRTTPRHQKILQNITSYNTYLVDLELNQFVYLSV